MHRCHVVDVNYKTWIQFTGMSDPMRFALGTFAPAGGRPFAGLVLGDRVADLGPLLGPEITLRALVDDWDRRAGELQALADRLDPAQAEHALGDLRPLPPLDRWGQV